MLLNYQEFGQGRPVIILHGLFGSARNWQGIARALAADHHVITPDLRNHGQSPHTDSMTYHEMADDVIRILDKLKIGEAVIIGHSMGGKVAMTAALTEPERFNGLIIADIAPVTYAHDFALLIEAMNSIRLSNITSRANAEAQLEQFIKEKSLVQFIIQNLVRTENGFRWRINLKQISSSMASLGQFPESLQGRSSRLPALFLGGADSNYLRSMHNPAIFEYFPAAEITMIEGAGHWLHADKPNEFLENIKSFINYV